MQEQSQVKLARYPMMIGNLIHSNHFLKVFSTIALIIVLFQILLLLKLAAREPVVIPLRQDATEFSVGSMPNAAVEVKRAVSKYLETRYQWGPENVKDRLEAAKVFIAPQSMKAYMTATANLALFSIQKVVAQRVYPGEIDVDLVKGTVAIFGDRITTIQGLKAAGNLNLELTFESGPRNKENPWGIYITREKESQ